VPTAIAVTSPDLVLPPTDRQTPTAALLPPPGSRPLDAALGETQTLLDQCGYIVALYPANIPPAHERRLHTVRALLESNRIALIKLDLPPLAVAVLVRQLRQLSVCGFGPGIVASAVRLLSHYVYAGAVLGTVTRLDRIPVDLKSHAKSWVPGSQFAVLTHPEPHLVKVGAGKLPGPEFLTQLLVAKGSLQSDWPTETLAPGWRVQATRETPLPSVSPDWWGTPRMIEFAAFLPDTSVLHQLVSSVRREVCSWCGLELIGDRCGFCSAAIAPAENHRRAAGALTRGTAT
jgi:hypothetical protein